jgi:hypothetical protein
MGDGDVDNKQLWAAISGRVRQMSYLGAPAVPAMWALAIWASKQVNPVSLVPETGKETGKPLRKRSRKARKQRVTKERAADGSTSGKDARSRARSSPPDSQFNA